MCGKALFHALILVLMTAVCGHAQNASRNILIYVLSDQYEDDTWRDWYRNPAHLDAIVADLNAIGFQVEILDRKSTPLLPISRLSEFSQVWISECDDDSVVDTTPEEVEALYAFCLAGGGVWLSLEGTLYGRTHDWTEDIGAYGELFGFEWIGDDFGPSKRTVSSSDHPVLADVTWLKFDPEVGIIVSPSGEMESIWQYAPDRSGILVTDGFPRGEGRRVVDSGWLMGYCWWDGHSQDSLQHGNLKCMQNIACWLEPGYFRMKQVTESGGGGPCTGCCHTEHRQPILNPEGTEFVFASTWDPDGILNNQERNTELFRYDISSGQFFEDTVTAEGTSFPCDFVDTKVTFVSSSSTLPGNLDANCDVFLYDLLYAGHIQSVTTTAGPQAIDANYTNACPPAWFSLTEWTTLANLHVDMSADARCVVWASNRNLPTSTSAAGENTDHNYEIFRKDLYTNDVHQRTHTTGGDTTSSASGANLWPRTSANGRRTVFVSNRYSDSAQADSYALVLAEDSGMVRRLTDVGLTVERDFPAFGADEACNYVVFSSNADPTGENPDGNHEIFLLSLRDDSFIQITQSQPPVHNRRPVMSGNALKVAFLSDGDFSGQNSDGSEELWIYHFDADQNYADRFIQVTRQDTTPEKGNDRTSWLDWHSLDRTGKHLAFCSNADLVAKNGDQSYELFLASFDWMSIAPHVAATSPASGSSARDINEIHVNFSKPMDETTVVADSFCLQASGGDGQFNDGNETATACLVVYDPNTCTATLLPQTALSDDTYQLTVMDSVLSTDGVPLNADAAPDGPGGPYRTIFRIDSIGPRVIAMAPGPGQTLAEPPTEIIVSFSEPIAPETATPRTVRVVASGGDDTFDDGNEYTIVLDSVEMVDATRILLGFGEIPLGPDTYRVLVGGQLTQTALAFDGVDDRVVVPDSPSFHNGTGLTVEAWVNPSGYRAWGTIVMKSWSVWWSDGFGLAHYTEPDETVNFFVRSYSGYAVGATVPTGRWSHVAGVYDGAALTIFVDGQASASLNAPGLSSDSSGELEIGSGAGSNYPWLGYIAEVRLWNRARTEKEIAASMYRYCTGHEPGLTAYWTFDEPLTQTVRDRTGNGNDGTLGTDTGPNSDDPTWTLDAPALPHWVADSAGNALDQNGNGIGGEPDDTFQGGFRIE